MLAFSLVSTPVFICFFWIGSHFVPSELLVAFGHPSPFLSLDLSLWSPSRLNLAGHPPILGPCFSGLNFSSLLIF